jgi:hypothetical protein
VSAILLNVAGGLRDVLGPWETMSVTGVHAIQRYLKSFEDREEMPGSKAGSVPQSSTEVHPNRERELGLDRRETG